MQSLFMGNYLLNNQALLILVTIWALVWKGLALWQSGRRNQKIWFVALLIINTLGILEILYIFVFSKMSRRAGSALGGKVEAKKSFTAEEAKKIGESLGIKWDKYDMEQFRMGLDVELEHGRCDSHTNVSNDDSEITGKIALAHLNEFSDYYTRLDKMEKEL